MSSVVMFLGMPFSVLCGHLGVELGVARIWNFSEGELIASHTRLVRQIESNGRFTGSKLLPKDHSTAASRGVSTRGSMSVAITKSHFFTGTSGFCLFIYT